MVRAAPPGSRCRGVGRAGAAGGSGPRAGAGGGAGARHTREASLKAGEGWPGGGGGPGPVAVAAGAGGSCRLAVLPRGVAAACSGPRRSGERRRGGGGQVPLRGREPAALGARASRWARAEAACWGARRGMEVRKRNRDL